MKSKPPSIGKRLQWRIECGAFLIAERLLMLVPIDTLWRRGAALSWAGRLFASRRLNVQNNLRTVLGPASAREDVAALTREVFRHTAANLLTSLRGTHLPLDQIRKVVTFENLQLAERALAHKKGVIAVTSHMGNWELSTQTMAAFRPEIKMGCVFRPLNNIYLDRIIRERREKNDMTMFAKLSSLHAPIRFLKDNGMLTLVVDQRAGRTGTLTPFFGRLMSMSPLPELMHRRTGAPVLGASMRTTAPGRWTIRFHQPPLDPGETFTTAHMAALVETLIRDSIVDEFWMQDLWRINKRRPLELRGKRGPVRLERDRHKPLYPFAVLVRVPDDPERFAETLPALEALVASRPDLDLHLLARAHLRDAAAASKLPHCFHSLEDPRFPDHLQLAVVLDDRELAARELAHLFDGPLYAFPAIAPATARPIASDPSLPPRQRWLEALRSLGMHAPPLTIHYI